MAIGHLPTRGYGTGTLSGDPNLVAVRGYTSGVAVVVETPDPSKGAGSGRRKLWSVDEWLKRYHAADEPVRDAAAPVKQPPPIPEVTTDLLPAHIEALKGLTETLSAQRVQSDVNLKALAQISEQLTIAEERLIDDNAALLLLLLTLE